MTQALEDAMAEIARLPPEEQDRLGEWLLSELAEDREWERRFAESAEALGRLAAEARADVSSSRATDLDPDRR